MKTINDLLKAGRKKWPSATYIGRKGQGNIVIPQEGDAYFMGPENVPTLNPDKIPEGEYLYVEPVRRQRHIIRKLPSGELRV